MGSCDIQYASTEEVLVVFVREVQRGPKEGGGRSRKGREGSL